MSAPIGGDGRTSTNTGCIVGRQQHRRHVTGRRNLEAAAQRIEDAVTERRHVEGTLFEHESVEPGDDGRRDRCRPPRTRGTRCAVDPSRSRRVRRARRRRRSPVRSDPRGAARRRTSRRRRRSSRPPGSAAHNTMPGTSGSASGSMLCWNVSAIRRSSLNACARSRPCAARRARSSATGRSDGVVATPRVRERERHDAEHARRATSAAPTTPTTLRACGRLRRRPADRRPRDRSGAA